VDPRFNTGNKSTESTGRDRLQKFAAWMFTQPANALVAGHSLWFKSFFNEFLPANANHEAKAKKMTNGAAVGFEYA
jgi:hypothetical protein